MLQRFLTALTSGFVMIECSFTKLATTMLDSNHHISITLIFDYDGSLYRLTCGY